MGDDGLATVPGDCGCDRPGLSLLHPGDFHTLKGGEKHGSPGIPCGFFRCLGLLFDLGQLSKERFASSSDCS